jgi:hypothetical protein
MHRTARLVFLGLAVLSELANAQTSPKIKKEVALQPAVAEQLLTNFVRENKDHSVNATVIKATDDAIPLGLSCSSSSSGTVTGTADENGNVRGTTNSDTTTNCRQRYEHKQRMTIAMNDSLNPDAMYLIETECAQSQFTMIGIAPTRLHFPCLLPQVGVAGPVVIKAGKHGTFFVEVYLIPPPRKLGDKPKGETYKFAVLSMSRAIFEHQ